jgi:hypothetical protein
MQLNSVAGLSVNVTTIYNAYTVANSDTHICCNASGSLAITFPTATGSGRVLQVTSILNSSTGVVSTALGMDLFFSVGNYATGSFPVPYAHTAIFTDVAPNKWILIYA